MVPNKGENEMDQQSEPEVTVLTDEQLAEVAGGPVIHNVPPAAG